MKSWGTLITGLYALIVLVLLTPATLLLVGGSNVTMIELRAVYKGVIPWILAAIVVVCQIVLLWLSVDTSRKKLKAQTPIVLTGLITGFLLTIVTSVVGLAAFIVIWGEDAVPDLGSVWPVVGVFLVSWIVWGVVFYRMTRNSTDPVTRAVSWLFRGSVLELLIAVPSHVIVRRRHDCCAPGLTAFGITSGIAIMLLSFGPSVLLLYKKRMDAYSAKR
jgi:hypothetical protein